MVPITHGSKPSAGAPTLASTPTKHTPKPTPLKSHATPKAQAFPSPGQSCSTRSKRSTPFKPLTPYSAKKIKMDPAAPVVQLPTPSNESKQLHQKPGTSLQARASIKTDTSLQRRERQLDAELAHYTNQKDHALKAINYINNHESAKVHSLIQKWRDVAQRASNYHLNSLHTKVSRMGGPLEFRKRQSKQSMFDEDDDELIQKYECFINSSAFDDLTRDEQNEVKSKLAQLQDGDAATANDAGLNDDEITMEELYSLLKLDYRLVYEDEGLN